MNIINLFKALKLKKEEFYESYPASYAIQAIFTLALSGFTFVKTLRGLESRSFNFIEVLFNISFY